MYEILTPSDTPNKNDRDTILYSPGNLYSERLRSHYHSRKRQSLRCGLVFRYTKRELLEKCREEQEHSIACQDFSQAHPLPGSKRNHPLVLNKGFVLIQEPLGSEHFRISPVFTIVKQAPEVNQNESILNRNINMSCLLLL